MSFEIKKKLRSYFFEVQDNTNLQCTKFIICSVLLVCASYPPKLFSEDLITNFQPIGIFKILPQVPTADYFAWISTFFRLFLLGAILNIQTRFCLLGATVFGLYNLIYKYNFGVIYHGNWMIVTGLMLLLAIPGGAWRPGYKGIHALWPLRLLQVYICMVYTSAGIQKFIRSGFEWAWSENLAIRIYSNKMTPLAEFMMNQDPIVLRIIATVVLLTEMTSLAALFSRKLAVTYMVAWALMHLGIQLTFAYHMDFLMKHCVLCCIFILA